jgi:uncharacterized protein HemX
MPQPPHPERASADQNLSRPSRLAAMAIIAVLILGFAAAGCGSSSSSSKTTSSTATTALTKAQFVARANAICSTGNNQIAAADAKLSKNPTKAQITAVVKTTTAPSIQAQINGIRALGAPSGDKATVTNMLNLAQADLNKVKSNPASLATGGASPFADFAKVAHPYGLTACAQNA